MPSSTSTARRAVVLLSGGLDSATTLAIARDAGFECFCLSLDYDQRNRSELAAASRVARALGATEHRVLQLSLGAFGGSALTDEDIAVPVDGAQAGIPVIDGGNLVQNVMTAIESVAQTLKQIEQYQTQLQQYENMLQNTMAPAAYIWDQAQSPISRQRDRQSNINPTHAASLHRSRLGETTGHVPRNAQ